MINEAAINEAAINEAAINEAAINAANWWVEAIDKEKPLFPDRKEKIRCAILTAIVVQWTFRTSNIDGAPATPIVISSANVIQMTRPAFGFFLTKVFEEFRFGVVPPRGFIVMSVSDEDVMVSRGSADFEVVWHGERSGR